jgi:2,3-bisphosphoglycerate-independent phosphoglycerate mutase
MAAGIRSNAFMKHVLLIFLDGIGLGKDDPTINPFAAANVPTLLGLANGHRWLASTGVQTSSRASFVPTDANMGVAGKPQSATGQAAILTGRNVPKLVGEHYGPRPNESIRAIISEDNIFKQVVARGMTASLLEAYPPQWHEAINRGKRLRASYQLAPYEAGIAHFTEADLYAGRALTMDWTGEGWRTQLGYTDSPLFTPQAGGAKMVELSRKYHFAMFPHWYTDTIGHRSTVEEGVRILELFDHVMAGALAEWNDDEGLIIITSDHGNMEDLSHSKHTENLVPTIIIGSGKEAFAHGLHTLADIAPRIAAYLFDEPL